jgi:UPF0755 protein
MKKFIVLCVLLGLAAVLTVSAVGYRFLNQPLPLEGAEVIDVPTGTGVQTLADRLFVRGLVPYAAWVRWAARATGYDTKLKAGEYRLEPPMSLKDVFIKIADGKVVMHRLTLPEGLTTAAFLKLIAENDFLSGPLTADVKEGELLPETYTFARGTPRAKLINEARQAMKRRLGEIWAARAPDLPLKTPEDLLILASIVEKETGLARERRQVASVFVNRLKAGMLLQTDPSVIYALTKGKTELNRPLTHQDLGIDSLYNTYKYAGLPPTAIASPGVASLEAAAHPDQTPYFYFVANGKGGHNFAATLAEHNRNVSAWRRINR